MKLGATDVSLLLPIHDLRTQHTLNRICKSYAVSKFLLLQIDICLYVFVTTSAEVHHAVEIETTF